MHSGSWFRGLVERAEANWPARFVPAFRSRAWRAATSHAGIAASRSLGVLLLAGCVADRYGGQSAPDQMARVAVDPSVAARRELAWKKRRLVFNNDGDDHLSTGPATSEGFLSSRLTPLRGSHVDTLVYCTSRPFGMFTHATRVGDVLTDPMVRGERRNLVPELLALGTDPLELAVGFGRENGMEIIWSFRMNDCHDTSHSPQKPHFFFSTFKKEHPEWLLGARGRRPRIGNWTAVDFARPEVRSFACEVVRDIVMRYDVDGVELDFFRHLVYFRSVSQGGAATADERAMMTELVRSVRQVLDEASKVRKRPMLLLVRTPDHAAYCREIGLDLERWLAERLVDIWVAGGDFRLNHRHTSVELGGKYDVPVWCDLDPSIRHDAAGRFGRNSIASLRARALGAWEARAAAIYLFNHFNPRHPLWRELGEPSLLRSRPRTYFANVMGKSGFFTEDRALVGGQRFRRLTAPHPASPRRLTPSEPMAIPFELGEVVTEVAQAHTGRVAATCHVQLTGASDVKARWNGTALGAGLPADGWLVFDVPQTLLRSGISVLELRALSATRSAGDWDLQSEAEAIWSSGSGQGVPWAFGRGSARTHRELVEGALLIADRGTEPGDYLYASLAWQADPEQPAVVEISAKVASGKNGIIVANARHEELIWLQPDQVTLESSGVVHSMDTTGGYHVYRVELRGETITLGVDGAPCVEGQLTRPAHSGRNVLAIGAASSPTLGEACWRSVRYETGQVGAVVYDAVLAVGEGG